MTNKDTTSNGPVKPDVKKKDIEAEIVAMREWQLKSVEKIEYWPDSETENRLKILRELLSEEDSSTSYRSAILSRWISELDAKMVEDKFTVEVSDDEITVTEKDE